MNPKKTNISTWQLALMTSAAVISLRGLPMMAQEELTMFFYIFFATSLGYDSYKCNKPLLSGLLHLYLNKFS